MLTAIKYEELPKIKHFFGNIRFFMGNSVLDGMIGDAFVDNATNPKIAFLIVRSYCFIAGEIEDEKLKKIIDANYKKYTIIPSDTIKLQLEKIYPNELIKKERYSIKKEPVFDKEALNIFINKLPKVYELVKIDSTLAERIKREKWINITDNYKEYGIGICCVYQDEIVGVASSNIFYRDGIEVNIKVHENYRKQGIATAMASKLILECLENNKKISWDAANKNSLELAKKLGFVYDSTYYVYTFCEIR
ncbi:MAG: GNAT family N-acetyltransferase [Clostridia bacterium]